MPLSGPLSSLPCLQRRTSRSVRSTTGPFGSRPRFGNSKDFNHSEIRVAATLRQSNGCSPCSAASIWHCVWSRRRWRSIHSTPMFTATGQCAAVRQPIAGSGTGSAARHAIQPESLGQLSTLRDHSAAGGKAYGSAERNRQGRARIGSRDRHPGCNRAASGESRRGQPAPGSKS